MISYSPFYETLKKKNLSEYALIYKHGILPDTLQRIRHDKVITTKTLDTLCSVLECEVSDVIKYIPPEKI
nr:helix-turn-helix domain-containing protein [uncultured Blautia sp.]